MKANNLLGNILGVLTLTPYHYWRKNHAFHHSFSGNLDKRGIGDVDTFTVKEYQAFSLPRKIWYRIYRHPLFLIFLSPFLLFGLKHRLPLDNPFHSVKSWVNIMMTNAGIVAIVWALIHFFGYKALFVVYVPVMWIGAAIGVVQFYIQHQYEDTYWNKGSEWKAVDASLLGSSYFDYSPAINWLTNNISLHHIHHLNMHVPSYRLRECMKAIPELQLALKRTFKDIPACFRLALWDEEKKMLVGFP